MSLIPKAIELAFTVHGDRVSPGGMPAIEHALRVWRRFRRLRPLGSLSWRRYEELACVALLHGVIRDGGVAEDELRTEFGTFVAAGVARTGHGLPPALSDDPDLQLIMVLDRLDTLSAAALGPAELAARADELERACLPCARAFSHELARELEFQLDDVRRELQLLQ
jgi:hypothetical protein